jgi:bacillithiol system protein YtxJ
MTATTKFIPLTSNENFKAVLDSSYSAPQIILKHSNTCPISGDAYDRISKLGRNVHLVVVQESRPVSNEIEAATGVQHESPQVLVIKDGKVTWNASHRKVTADAVLAAL